MRRREDSAGSTPSAGRRACQPHDVCLAGMRGAAAASKGVFLAGNSAAVAQPACPRARAQGEARSWPGVHRAVHCMPFDSRSARMSRRQDGPRQHGEGGDPRADAEHTASQCRPALVRPPLRPPPCPSRQWRGRRPSAAGGEAARDRTGSTERHNRPLSRPPSLPGPMFY